MTGRQPYRFTAPVIYWRGPAPYIFAHLPDEVGEQVRSLGPSASYGWGVIPVEAEIDGVRFTTSLFPRDGTYLLPLKVAVRKRLDLPEGTRIDVVMWLTSPRLGPA
jgi:hypothetical protein